MLNLTMMMTTTIIRNWPTAGCLLHRLNKLRSPSKIPLG
jgi:hypothetical protein